MDHPANLGQVLKDTEALNKILVHRQKKGASRPKLLSESTVAKRKQQREVVHEEEQQESEEHQQYLRQCLSKVQQQCEKIRRKTETKIATSNSAQIPIVESEQAIRIQQTSSFISCVLKEVKKCAAIFDDSSVKLNSTSKEDVLYSVKLLVDTALGQHELQKSILANLIEFDPGENLGDQKVNAMNQNDRYAFEARKQERKLGYVNKLGLQKKLSENKPTFQQALKNFAKNITACNKSSRLKVLQQQGEKFSQVLVELIERLAKHIQSVETKAFQDKVSELKSKFQLELNNRNKEQGNSKIEVQMWRKKFSDSEAEKRVLNELSQEKRAIAQSLENQLSKIKDSLSKTNESLSKTQHQYQMVKQQHQRLRQRFNDLDTELQSKRIFIDETIYNSNALFSKIFSKKIELKHQTFINELQRLSMEPNTIKLLKRDESQVLKISSGIIDRMSEVQQRFLVSILEKEKRQQLRKLKTLYKMDNLNSVNFHQYIDDINDVLLIVELKTGHFIAGFTQHPVNEDKVPGRGFLAGINKEVVLRVSSNSKSKNPKIVSPDAYYIIFGNSELRIKQGDGFAFSNIGVANSYLDAAEQGLNYWDLLGQVPSERNPAELKREVELINYEFYQVYFK